MNSPAPKPPKALRVFDSAHLFSGRDWYREQGFLQNYSDAFKSTATFQDIAKQAARWQFDQDTEEIEKLKKENELIAAKINEAFDKLEALYVKSKDISIELNTAYLRILQLEAAIKVALDGDGEDWDRNRREWLKAALEAKNGGK